MFTTLIESELYNGEHPFRGFKKLKEQTAETGYLTLEEIDALLAALSGDNRKIAVLYLSTGARWGEAARLKAENVINTGCLSLRRKPTHRVRSRSLMTLRLT